MSKFCRGYAALCVWSLGLWQLSPAPAAGQLFGPAQFQLSGSVHLDEVESSVRGQLERVRACVADQQWDEAVETLRAISENPGGKVIALSENRYINLADYCHAQIAALPLPALELYRQRVDPLAERWYQEGIAGRDGAKLGDVAARLFCSSWGRVLALGEMALERGYYGTARTYWERILELPPEAVSADRFDAAVRRPADAGEQPGSGAAWPGFGIVPTVRQIRPCTGCGMMIR